MERAIIIARDSHEIAFLHSRLFKVFYGFLCKKESNKIKCQVGNSKSEKARTINALAFLD